MVVKYRSVNHSHSDSMEPIRIPLDHYILILYIYSSFKGVARPRKASEGGRMGRFAMDVSIRFIWDGGGLLYL